jgi:hypothetical protein
MKRPDLAAQLTAILKIEAPELAPEKLRAIELAVRRELGGQRLWVQKAPRLAKAALLGNELAHGIPMHQACEKIGVCARHARRLRKDNGDISRHKRNSKVL